MNLKIVQRFALYAYYTLIIDSLLVPTKVLTLNKEIFVCRKYLVSQLLPLKKSNLIQIGGIKDVGPTSALEVLL